MLVVCLDNLGCFTKDKIYEVLDFNKETNMYYIISDTNEKAWINANSFREIILK